SGSSRVADFPPSAGSWLMLVLMYIATTAAMINFGIPRIRTIGVDPLLGTLVALSIWFMGPVLVWSAGQEYAANSARKFLPRWFDNLAYILALLGLCAWIAYPFAWMLWQFFGTNLLIVGGVLVVGLAGWALMALASGLVIGILIAPLVIWVNRKR